MVANTAALRSTVGAAFDARERGWGLDNGRALFTFQLSFGWCAVFLRPGGRSGNLVWGEQEGTNLNGC